MEEVPSEYEKAMAQIKYQFGYGNVYAVNGILVKSAASVSSLEVSDLANGVYIATVTIDGATTTIKITK